MKRVTKMRQYWRILLVVGVVWLMGLGCENGCRSIPEPPQGLAGSYELIESVPQDAKLVVFSENLSDLLEQMQWALNAFPLSLAGPVEEELQRWHQAGAKVDAPALAFWSDGQWALITWVDHERQVELDEWPSEGERRTVDPGMRGGAGWREYDAQGQWQNWVSSDGRRIARGWSLQPDRASLDEVIWGLEEGDYWDLESRRELLGIPPSSEDAGDAEQAVADGDEKSGSQTSTVVVRGVVDGQALMANLKGQERAGFLLDVLSRQVGDIFWRVRPGDDDGWVVDIKASGDDDSAMPVGDLGQARGALPDIGGLVRPGTPAVARLSVEPQKLFDLLRGGLEVEERQRLDQTLEVLATELEIDLKEDVIDNLTGQVGVVIIGLRDEFFDASGLELVASLTRLNSTREAIIVPFDDRQKMEGVLDAFTQLSQGALRRQAMEHSTRYYWLDDGALEWALILGDQHLILVDSMVAFDHVASWERSPRPMRGTLAERGIDTMMEPNRGLAFYLDLATLRGIIKEGGRDQLASWLNPFDALRWEADVEGEQDRLKLTLWPSGRSAGGE